MITAEELFAIVALLTMTVFVVACIMLFFTGLYQLVMLMAEKRREIKHRRRYQP